jgi:hypothetical protein
MSERRGGLIFRRQLLRKHRGAKARFMQPPNVNYIRRVLCCDPASLERAAEFFGLDHTHPPDLFVLALLLAEDPFGKHKRGRKPGNVVWDSVKYLRLGFKYVELKYKHPGDSDTELAAAIVKDPEFREYRGNPELIRQRLPKAKRKYEEQKRYEEWLDEQALNAPDTDDGDDDRDDDRYSYLRN